jgi:hypothetical protein
VRLGAGREAIPNDASLRTENLSGVNLAVRNIAAIELSAERLGRASLKAGDVVELASTFFAHSQGYRVEWKGRFTLRDASGHENPKP